MTPCKGGGCCSSNSNSNTTGWCRNKEKKFVEAGEIHHHGHHHDHHHNRHHHEKHNHTGCCRKNENAIDNAVDHHSHGHGHDHDNHHGKHDNTDCSRRNETAMVNAVDRRSHDHVHGHNHDHRHGKHNNTGCSRKNETTTVNAVDHRSHDDCHQHNNHHAKPNNADCSKKNETTSVDAIHHHQDQGHDHDHHNHHNHHHNDSCNHIVVDDDEDGDQEGVSTCLAVIGEEGTTISLFDAQGKVKSFSYKGDIRKLCFSSHGQDADDLLTPCFDDEGNHGTPEESCFCGVDTPHLHAHLHDPKTCNDDDTGDSNKKKNANRDNDIMNLASLTLHPTDDADDDDDSVDVNHDANIEREGSNIMEAGPEQHPGKVYKTGPKEEAESETGPEQELVNNRNIRENKDQANLTKNDVKAGSNVPTISRHQSVKVRDKDNNHIEVLVRAKSHGEIHVEHTCNDCGDQHELGLLKFIGKRRWSSMENHVNVHFFLATETVGQKQKSCSIHYHHDAVGPQPAAKLTEIRDHEVECHSCHPRRPSFMNIFKTECSRVIAAREEGLKVTRRISTMILEPMDENRCCRSGTCTAGSKLHSSIPPGGSFKFFSTQAWCGFIERRRSSKKFCVPMLSPAGATHQKTCSSSCCPPDRSACCSETETTSHCCASETERYLEECTADMLVVEPEKQSGKVVRSTFLCTKICCSSEVPMINSVLKPLPGIEKLMVNVPLKNVIVDHDFQVISAMDIHRALELNHFGASILRDGGLVAASQEKTTKSATKGRSRFYVEHICCASEIPMIRSVVTPMDGVSNVMINVTTKMVYVDHVFATVTAQAICDALNADEFGARIDHDAATDVVAANISFVASILSFDVSGNNGTPSTEKLTDFLRTYDPSQMETFLVDLPLKKITVVHNPLLISAEDIVTALHDKTGLHSIIEKDGKDQQVWEFSELNLEEEVVIEQPTVRIRPTVLLSGIFWIVSMLSLIGGKWDYLKYVGLLSVAFGLPPIAIKAFRTLQRFQFDANCLMLFAAVGAVALQEFEEAAAVTFLFALSEWLEVRATAKARKALSSIVQLKPERANLVHPQTGELLVVPVGVVPVGSLVSVRSGDKIPCDGVVVEGRSTVDESSLTGESRPVRKGPRDKVSGGTVNSGQTQLMVRTTCSADDSAVARLIRLVEEAQANRSDTEKLVDEFARVYTPVVVLAALAMCTIPWAWGREMGIKWTNNGLVLIVIACPCALIISTPVSYVAGLAATAKKGVLVKGGAHLEALGMVKKICFDKTGTLTKGSFELLHLNVIGNTRTRSQVLEYLSLMEERASHPMAQALVDAALREGVKAPNGLFVKDHTFLPGEGVCGMIDGHQVTIGNERLFKRLGLLSEAERKTITEWESTGGTIGFMSIGDEGIVCAYCVADAVRPESADVVAKLRRMGIEVTMLTGDNKDTAKAIGLPIGLQENEIQSELLPEEKLSFVSEMKDGRSRGQSILANLCSTPRLVLMCGDGVNDAPALVTADVGVAMGAGAALAMETADVTLLDSNLNKLVYSINMGRRVIWKIKENVIFSLAVKFLVLGFALGGKAQLWAAIASDVGAMILVTLNGMTLLPSRTSQKARQVLSNFMALFSWNNEKHTHSPTDDVEHGHDETLETQQSHDAVNQTSKGNQVMGGNLPSNTLSQTVPAEDSSEQIS